MINASIVLYKSNFDNIKPTIQSVLNSDLIDKLIIIDNSPSDNISEHLKDHRIFYLLNGKNIGFGAAHNIAIKKSIEINSKYHLVLNPDISFKRGTIENLLNFMEGSNDTGLIMPKILYPDGRVQYLPKLLPSPFSLIKRKLPLPKNIYSKLMFNYEFRFTDDSNVYICPIVSGCFSLFRTNVFKKIGLYDERFFMYFEDIDISRRVSKYFKTIYFPKVSIFHEYGKGAQSDLKLFKIFISSAIKYFNKWGWVFDAERDDINKLAIKN